MVTLTFLGLDQFVVGHYSKDHTKALANLFEVEEDDLDFVAPNNMVFHNGVEQTSWNVTVKVFAPEECQPLEGKVAKYLLDTVKDFAINVRVVFEYFHEHRIHESLNPDYPRFITESNIVSDEYDPGFDDEDGDMPDPRDRADLDPNDENQLFLGNAFEGFEEKLEKARAEKLEQENLDKEKNSAK